MLLLAHSAAFYRCEFPKDDHGRPTSMLTLASTSWEVLPVRQEVFRAADTVITLPRETNTYACVQLRKNDACPVAMLRQSLVCLCLRILAAMKTVRRGERALPGYQEPPESSNDGLHSRNDWQRFCASQCFTAGSTSAAAVAPEDCRPSRR